MAENTIIIGAYWGDEGKGKIVDLIAADADWVARFNGGDNAGHTIVAEGKKTILHILPSGAVRGKNVAIGPDVFVNPEALLKDLQSVKDYKGRIVVDERAHVILPYHLTLDDGGKLGTTKRGIGPAAEDRASRTRDITFSDLISEKFREKLHEVLKEKEPVLRNTGISNMADYENEVSRTCSEYASRMKPLIGNAGLELHNAIQRGEKVILEGAQAALLDIVHGTRPYVTSSNTTAGGAFANLGLNPMHFKVVGVAKAYPTRVGEGPFPTELKNELGRRIQEDGHEFGATTGRPRKAGMPDFVALRYSARINSFDEIAVTKLDVLAGKEFTAAVKYEKERETTENFPFMLEGWQPVYGKTYYFESFTEAEAERMCKEGYTSLPAGMRDYLEDMAAAIKTPISMVSLSPKREVTLTKGVLEATAKFAK